MVPKGLESPWSLGWAWPGPYPLGVWESASSLETLLLSHARRTAGCELDGWVLGAQVFCSQAALAQAEFWRRPVTVPSDLDYSEGAWPELPTGSAFRAWFSSLRDAPSA